MTIPALVVLDSASIGLETVHVPETLPGIILESHIVPKTLAVHVLGPEIILDTLLVLKSLAVHVPGPEIILESLIVRKSPVLVETVPQMALDLPLVMNTLTEKLNVEHVEVARSPRLLLVPLPWKLP